LPVSVRTTSALKPRLVCALSCQSPEKPRVIVTACAEGESAAADIESAAQRIESLRDMRGSVVPSAPPVAAGCIVTSGAIVNNEQFHPAQRRVLPSAA